MTRFRWLLAGMVATWLLAQPSGAAFAGTGALSPDAAADAAALLHPAVLAAERSLLRVQGQAADTAVLVRNPTVSGGLSLDGTRTGVSAVQPLSFTGEGAAARAAADAQVSATELRLKRARLAAAAEARVAYVNAIVRSGQVEIAHKNVELAGRLREAVERQHSAGGASLLDVRLARLAQVQAGARLLQARESEVQSLRTLATLVGQPVAADALAGDPQSAAPEPADGVPDVPRSDVQAARALLNAAEAELARQRRGSLPPIGVGASMEVEHGHTFIGPTVSIALPVFNRNLAGRGDASGQVREAEGAERAVRARAVTERGTALRRVNEAHVLEAGMPDDPLSEATAALKSIEAGYLSGELDLPTTVLLQREVLAGEAAALALSGGVARARIDVLLATDDPRLHSRLER